MLYSLVLLALGTAATAIPFKTADNSTLANGRVANDGFIDLGNGQWIVDAHNKGRRLHGVPDLTWSADSAQFATDNTPDCQMIHNPNPQGHGENLWWGAGFQNTPSADAMVLGSWYNEIVNYNFGAANGQLPSNFEAVGHFTQVVWRDTNAVGCALRQCGNQLLFRCNYTPQGNFIGSFDSQHVPPPINGQVQPFQF